LVPEEDPWLSLWLLAEASLERINEEIQEASNQQREQEIP
jgi:hypothetical protein